MSLQQEFFARKYVLVLLAILCTFLWGSSFPAIKAGYEALSLDSQDTPSLMVFAGVRFFLAGVFLLAFVYLTKRPSIPMSVNNLKQLTLLGATQTSLQYLFFYIGVANTTGVKASIMSATSTFFSVFIAHFLYQTEKLTQRKLVGCLLGFTGVLMVNFSHSLLAIDFSIKGEGAIVLAALILAVGSIYGKAVSQTLDPMCMTAWQLTIGGIILWLYGAIQGGQMGELTVTSVPLLIYLALLSSIAFTLWSLLLKHNPVGMVTIFSFLIPVFGSVLSGIFLGESFLEWKNLLALLFVCLGIYLVTRIKIKAV
ncbi:DMT family transporter [Marinomonas epiphytica]